MKKVLWELFLAAPFMSPVYFLYAEIPTSVYQSMIPTASFFGTFGYFILCLKMLNVGSFVVDRLMECLADAEG